MAQISKKKKFAVIAAALVAISGGVAYAYWTTTGAGTGTAATGDVDAVVVNQDALTSDLEPGVAAQTLSGDFDNPNPGDVYITSVTVSIDSVTKAVGAVAGTCDATDYTLTDATMAVGADIPTGDGVGSWTGATIAFNNKATNQDQCKGATVNLAYTAS